MSYKYVAHDALFVDWYDSKWVYSMNCFACIFVQIAWVLQSIKSIGDYCKYRYVGKDSDSEHSQTRRENRKMCRSWAGKFYATGEHICQCKIYIYIYIYIYIVEQKHSKMHLFTMSTFIDNRRNLNVYGIGIGIYLLARRNLLWDILKLPSSHRAALSLCVILTL